MGHYMESGRNLSIPTILLPTMAVDAVEVEPVVYAEGAGLGTRSTEYEPPAFPIFICVEMVLLPIAAALAAATAASASSSLELKFNSTCTSPVASPVT
uniref:Uncharacterized protein n=1 Tax=Glossina palpalis gambiensis TaxID=67801 RepID=A0A1B0BTM3_9MUSC